MPLTGRIEGPWSHGCLGVEDEKQVNYRIGQDVWQEEKVKETEMQQRKIKEGDRGKATNLFLFSVKTVRSPVDLTMSLNGQYHRALLWLWIWKRKRQEDESKNKLELEEKDSFKRKKSMTTK